MQRQPLFTFVQQFDCLNPFELDNFCEMIVINLVDTIGKQAPTFKDLKVGRLSRALVHTIRQIISKIAYTDFLFQFSTISPHNLNKISQTLLISFEDMQARDESGTVLEINRENVIEALTDTMRRLKLELARDRIEEVRHLIEEEYRNTHTPLPIKDQGDGVFQYRHRAANA